MNGDLDSNGFSNKNVANTEAKTDGLNKKISEIFLDDVLRFDGNLGNSLRLAVIGRRNYNRFISISPIQLQRSDIYSLTSINTFADSLFKIGLKSLNNDKYSLIELEDLLILKKFLIQQIMEMLQISNMLII